MGVHQKAALFGKFVFVPDREWPEGSTFPKVEFEAGLKRGNWEPGSRYVLMGVEYVVEKYGTRLIAKARTGEVICG